MKIRFSTEGSIYQAPIKRVTVAAKWFFAWRRLMAMAALMLLAGSARAQSVELPAIASPEVAATPSHLQVTIVSPADGDTTAERTIKIAVLVRTTANSAIKLYPLVNGQPLATPERGLLRQSMPRPFSGKEEPPRDIETLHKLTVPIPAANCSIAVVAESAGLRSTSAEVRLTWAGASDFVVKPTLYLLAIGVSTYRDSSLSLRYAAKDADDFVRTLRLQQGSLYQHVEARILLDAQATRDNILDGMQWLQQQTTAKDVAVIFLAGHGNDDPSTGVYYFLPHDADLKAIKRSMVAQQEIQLTLRSIAGKTLLFLDTCHAASVIAGTQERALPDISRVVKELANVDNGVVVYAAATGRQLSQESSRWDNGAFTKAVVEGLLGRAAYYPDRPITIQMLFVYVSERVKQLTTGTQTPILVMPQAISDFPLAIAPPQPSQTSQPAATAPLSGLASVSVGLPATKPHADSRPRAPVGVPLYKQPGLWLTIGVGAVVLGGLITAAVFVARAIHSVENLPEDTPPLLTFTKVE